ncbi:unnamed protein product [Lampetra planeri]
MTMRAAEEFERPPTVQKLTRGPQDSRSELGALHSAFRALRSVLSTSGIVIILPLGKWLPLNAEINSGDSSPMLKMRSQAAESNRDAGSVRWHQEGAGLDSRALQTAHVPRFASF